MPSSLAFDLYGIWSLRRWDDGFVAKPPVSHNEKPEHAARKTEMHLQLDCEQDRFVHYYYYQSHRITQLALGSLFVFIFTPLCKQRPVGRVESSKYNLFYPTYSSAYCIRTTRIALIRNSISEICCFELNMKFVSLSEHKNMQLKTYADIESVCVLHTRILY